MSLLGIITSPGSIVAFEAMLATSSSLLAPACPLRGSYRIPLKLYSMVALGEGCAAGLKKRKNPAIPSGPAAHRSCLFPSTLSLV